MCMGETPFSEEQAPRIPFQAEHEVGGETCAMCSSAAIHSITAVDCPLGKQGWSPRWTGQRCRHQFRSQNGSSTSTPRPARERCAPLCYKLMEFLKLTNTDPFAAYFVVTGDATPDGMRVLRSVLGAISSLPIGRGAQNGSSASTPRPARARYLSIYIDLYLYVCLSIYLCIYLSIYISICLSIYIYIYISI